jgi:hypothetical protein
LVVGDGGLRAFDDARFIRAMRLTSGCYEKEAKIVYGDIELTQGWRVRLARRRRKQALGGVGLVLKEGGGLDLFPGRRFGILAFRLFCFVVQAYKLLRI